MSIVYDSNNFLNGRNCLGNVEHFFHISHKSLGYKTSSTNYSCTTDLYKVYGNNVNKAPFEVDQIILLNILMSNTEQICLKNILMK